MYAMRGITLGALALVAAVAVALGTGEALGQKKKYRKDAPKAPPAKGLLPNDAKLTASQLAAHIDSVLAKKAEAEKVALSPRCDDAEFLRRVYLDITGKIPTAEQAALFLDSKESNKRAKLIDELLASKEYGRHMADIWQALLLPRNSDNRRVMLYYPNLVKWFEEKFNANSPWDQMVREVLTATGDVNKTGPAVYFLANRTADKVTDNASRMFLGVQLQCAQCHNHPFADYKQDEYWGMAAFFLHVRPSGNPNKAAKEKAGVNIVEVQNAKRGKKMGLPESAKILPPKFLQADRPKVSEREPLRPVVAKWVASPDNPFFAKAMANRMWAQYMGRGIVNPVDDMHDANVPSHPELLQDLSRQFANSGFDVKYLVRAICNSEAYQRSSKPAGNNADAAPELHARMLVKVLTPEQMYDSLQGLIAAEARPGKARAKQKGRGPGPREAFVNFFSAEEGADPTDYQTGIPQVLQLMNSPRLNSSAALAKIVRSSKGEDEAVEKLYLAVLSRRPTGRDKAIVKKFLARNEDNRREAYAGLMWALLNSSEFALNR